MLQKLPVHALRRAGAAVAMVSVVAMTSALLAPSASAADPGCPPTPSPDFSVPTPAGPPALESLTDPDDGQPDINVSIIGADHQYYSYLARFGADSDSVGPLGCLPGPAFGHPASALPDQADQRFEVGTDGNVLEQDVSGETPTGWKPVPGAVLSRSGVDAVARGNRTDIFYVKLTTKEIMYQTKIGDQWSSAATLGGATNETPSVAVREDGTITVFVTGTDDRIYHADGIVTPTSALWSRWQALPSGASTHAPAATVGYAPPSAQHEDLFVTGTNGGLYQASFTGPHFSFSGFHRILTVGTDARLDAASQGTGHMVVLWTSAGETDEAQFFFGSSAWQGPFLAPYMCPTCVQAAPAAKSSAASPEVSTRSLGVHARAPHHSS